MDLMKFQNRLPLTSVRPQPSIPSIGFLGCSCLGFLTSPRILSQFLTIETSPKGTPEEMRIRYIITYLIKDN